MMLQSSLESQALESQFSLQASLESQFPLHKDSLYFFFPPHLTKEQVWIPRAQRVTLGNTKGIPPPLGAQE